MMRRLCPRYVLLAFTLARPAVAGAIEQTITAADLAVAGITRVADIYMLAEGWDVNTTDGFSWSFIGRGLGTFQQPHLDVFIDNHRLDARFFDSVNLNLLGIAIAQLDSVRLGTSPALVLGEMTSGGYIHFFTSRRPSGWSLDGTVNMGNETGDPGPWAYTDRATRNVDRTGPSAEIIVARGNHNGQHAVTIVLQQHPFTDNALAPRTTKMGVDWPGISNVAPSLTIDRRLLGGWHQFRAAMGYGARLFRWFEPLGFEAPTNFLTVDLGLAGNLPRSHKSVVQYRLNYASKEFSETPIRIPFAYDWHRRHLSSNVEIDHAGADRTIKFGLGLDTHSLGTQATLSASAYAVARVYATLNTAPDPRTGYQFAASAARAGSQTLLNAIATVDWQLYGEQQVSLTAAAVQRSILMENSQLEWLRRGYDIYTWPDLDDPDSDGQMLGSIAEFTPANQFSLDVDWRFPLGSRTRLQLGLSYRRVTNLTLEQRQIAYDTTTFFFAVDNALALDEASQVLGAHASGTGRLTPGLQWHADYRYWSVLAATDIATDQWQKIPRHELSTRLIWRPASTLSVWLAMTTVSPTTWPEYSAISPAVYPIPKHRSNTYEDKVPSWTNIDLQLRKLLWDRRLATSVLLKNVFDQQVKYHPIGATFRLTLFIKIDLALD